MAKNFTALIFMLIISYFGFHAIFGEQGLSNWSRMQQEIAVLSSEKQKKTSSRLELKRKIYRLYPNSLDLDYVEELARSKFLFVYSDEIVLEPPAMTIQLPENEELFDLRN